MPPVNGAGVVQNVYNMDLMVDLQEPKVLASNYVTIFSNLALVSSLFLTVVAVRSPSILAFAEDNGNIWGSENTKIVAALTDTIFATSALANIGCVYECVSIVCRFSEIPHQFTKLFVKQAGLKFILMPYNLNDVGFVSFVAAATLYYSIILPQIAGYIVISLGVFIIANHYYGFWRVSSPARNELFRILNESKNIDRMLRKFVEGKRIDLIDIMNVLERNQVSLSLLRDGYVSLEEMARLCNASVAKIRDLKELLDDKDFIILE